MTKADFAKSPTKSATKICKETSEYMKKMSGEVEIIVASKPVSNSKCKKCGLPIAFKKVGDKWHPTNTDGSSHWDLCKTTIRAGKPFDAKTDMQSSGCITGSEYVEAECDCIPWEHCDNCCKETLPDEQQSHMNSI